MTSNCLTVAPGQPLNSWQKTGLQLVSQFRGRDVVLAIDLTESVGLNDEGRIRLRQIVTDSLRRGDRVYLVPFATDVLPADTVIEFRGKNDIDTVLNAIPLQADLNLQNTDIQNAELYIYQKLARINQCRLTQNEPLLPQSVVWLTDAPLGTNPGIDSSVWIETPANSPFRVENSLESQQRWQWLQALPLDSRSHPINTDTASEYKLTVVDVAPTVQEFCTPAPGGQETCLVTPYLIRQLWMPGVTLSLGIIALAVVLQKLISWRKKWQFIIESESTEEEAQICHLQHRQRIAIGEYDSNSVDSINCPGAELRAYIERVGNRLFIVPTRSAPIHYNGQEISNRTSVSGTSFRINCPDTTKQNKDFELFIRVKK